MPHDSLLATPIEDLTGVGPQRAALLERIGLRTARDALFYFPRDYQDFTQRREVRELEAGKMQTVLATVEEVELRAIGTGRTLLGVLLRSETGYLRGVWFNQPYMAEKFTYGQRLLVSGKPKLHGLMWEMSHPHVEMLAEEEEDPAGRILPVYSTTEGLPQWHIRRAVQAALDLCLERLEEVFPEPFLELHDVWPLRQALAQIHFPDSREALDRARRRFIYQELFILQLGLAVKRHRMQTQGHAPRLEVSAAIDARIRRLFPFTFTPSQDQAIREIASDMTGTCPMNRLLQGDVGSGKTVVAAYAMLLAVAHKHQAVLMAPTEILARQHWLTFDRILSHSQVRRACLTGGLTSKTRDDILLGIAGGALDLVIGTQAVIQDAVRFRNLGLVVIDEQHRFGVRQRAVLKQAGNDPHYLVMTATPIPRTVTLTLFGDLEVSTLRASPPGRQKVNTYQATEEQRARWWEFFCRKLRQGRQAYVVVPLVEESDQLNVANVQEAYESLANGGLEAFRLGLIHGRMTSAEKDAVMDDFRRGQIQVLVCTSVVEVGVDVPNATLMTIEGGERFGLAQLHQLRGRISRGSHPGFCCVFADPQTEESQERLRAFVSTTDGFKLAETDFQLRGPGEILGTRQHGLPPFRIADLVRDEAVVIEARRDAQALVSTDPDLSQPQHTALRRMMLTRYGELLELSDVG